MALPVTYAEKYSPVVDQRFALGSLTNSIVNQNFDWVGVSTIHVFSRDLATLNNYSTTGTNRYGTPAELGNADQELTLTQDKSMTWTIDRKSMDDTMGTMEAAATLAENIDNVVIPAIDTYRLGVIAGAAPAAGAVSGVSHIVTSAASAANAYEIFLNLQELLDNDKAPVGGRIAVCTPAFYNFLKLNQNFVRSGDLSQRMLLNGQVGEVDGVSIIKVPTSYMPANTDLLITNPLVAPGPIKLREFKIHFDAPGISGKKVA